MQRSSIRTSEMEDIKALTDLLVDQSVPYYLHCGYGLLAHDIAGDLDDCDLRVYEDINYVQQLLQEDGNYITKIEEPGKLFHRTKTATPYLKISSVNGTKFDISAEMAYENDSGKSFEIPYSRELFDHSEKLAIEGNTFSVAPLEILAMYYLFQRRGQREDKADLHMLSSIYRSEKFSNEKFESFVKDYVVNPEHREYISNLHEHAKHLF